MSEQNFDFKSLDLSKESDQKTFDEEFGKLSEEERNDLVGAAHDEAQKINEENRLAQGQKASEVFAGKSESETTKKLYGESAETISDIIRGRLVDKEKIYRFADFGSHKGELMKNVLTLLPDYNFYTIAIDIKSVLKDNNVARKKIVADLAKIPLEDNGADIGMMRYVLQWNDLEKQQAILKEISRIIKNFAIVQHAGADNDNPDDWRKSLDKLLGGIIPKIKRSGHFFSSGEEIAEWMVNNGINFERVMERRVEKVSNVLLKEWF